MRKPVPRPTAPYRVAYRSGRFIVIEHLDSGREQPFTLWDGNNVIEFCDTLECALETVRLRR